MRKGRSADKALQRLLKKDDHVEIRQVAFVDADGNVGSYTGDKVIGYVCDAQGYGFSVQANLMEKDTVCNSMAAAFEYAKGDLATRLIAALEAAEAEGGDLRGKRSAAIIVVDKKRHDNPWEGHIIDLCVEDNEQPLQELKRLVVLNQAYNLMKIGDAYLAAGNLRAANESYGKAMALTPGNHEMIFWRAVTLASAGEVDASLPFFRQAFEAWPAWVKLIPRLPASVVLPDDPALIARIMSVAPEMPAPDETPAESPEQEYSRFRVESLAIPLILRTGAMGAGTVMMRKTLKIPRSYFPTAFFAGLFVFGAALFGLTAYAQDEEPIASKDGVILSLNGPVTPPVAQYLAREIGIASAAGKEVIILEIDTPGGLVDSMKTIIKAILASDTPVATYVSPQGARSASAGLYIMYSAHVSAMAPATNTGAATPIEIGGSPSEKDPFDQNDPGQSPQSTPRNVDNPSPSSGGDEAEEPEDVRSAAPDESRDQDRTVSSPLGNDDALRAKIINDSVAYIRALAEERGRNADWAESAVRDAASVTANEALELGVVDIIADDIDDLLQQMNGRTVMTASGEKTLDTENVRLERVDATVVERILSFIADPNVAVILMSLATTGIIIEMWNPGSIFPGAVGVTCLVLGLYAFQVLPFNWLPLALMGIGAILVAVEAYTPTFGLAGLSGLGLLGAGMYFLFPDALRVSPAVIGVMLSVAGALLGLVLVAIVSSRSHGPMIGGDAVRRREGVVDDWDGKEGWVIVEGERWRARCDKPLRPGDRIRVIEVDGLVLVVKQAKAGGILGALAPGEA